MTDFKLWPCDSLAPGNLGSLFNICVSIFTNKKGQQVYCEDCIWVNIHKALVTVPDTLAR